MAVSSRLVSSEPTDPNYAVDKVVYRRSNCFLLMRFLVLTTALSVGVCNGEESGNSEDERSAIMRLLPSKADYAAKPTHMSSTNGVWLVKHNTKDGITHFSNPAKTMTGDEVFDARLLAEGVSKFLHQKANADLSKDCPESWVLRNVKPGIVIEELFTDVENEEVPPLEFNIFTVWGRVWAAQMNVVGEDRFYNGYAHRNGTMLIGHSTVPVWLDYAELVRIAENLGAHKDMFRTDIFVGVPAGVLKAGATTEERVAAVQIVVSESELYPTTIFPDENLCEEGARLWIAGYKMGNHRIIPNTEVPAAFLETGFCALSACDAKEGQAF